MWLFWVYPCEPPGSPERGTGWVKTGGPALNTKHPPVAVWTIELWRASTPLGICNCGSLDAVQQNINTSHQYIRRNPTHTSKADPIWHSYKNIIQSLSTASVILTVIGPTHPGRLFCAFLHVHLQLYPTIL
jgi:hypothetical protein